MYCILEKCGDHKISSSENFILQEIPEYLSVLHYVYTSHEKSTCDNRLRFMNIRKGAQKISMYQKYIFQMNEIRHTSKFSFFLPHEKLLLNFSSSFCVSYLVLSICLYQSEM